MIFSNVNNVLSQTSEQLCKSLTEESLTLGHQGVILPSFNVSSGHQNDSGANWSVFHEVATKTIPSIAQVKILCVTVTYKYMLQRYNG